MPGPPHSAAAIVQTLARPARATDNWGPLGETSSSRRHPSTVAQHVAQLEPPDEVHVVSPVQQDDRDEHVDALARPRRRDGKHHRQGGRRQQDGVQQSGGAEIEAGGPAHAHVYQLDQREHVLVFDLEVPLGREGLSAGDDGHPAQFIGPGRGQPVPVDVRQGRGRHDGPDDGDEPGRPPVRARGERSVFAGGKAL